MTDRAVPSAGASLLAVMALTWKRLLRGRTLWVAAGIALLPVAFAATLQSLGRSSGRMANDLVAFEQLLLALLPAMLIASSIGEEIEDRTTTYLWSRPVARWVVLIGKLATLVPVVVVLAVLNWAGALEMGLGKAPTLQSCVAMGTGAIALSMVAAGIATLAPRHGMALTVCYLLFFDLAIGVLPVSLRNLSITFHQRSMIDAFDRPATGFHFGPPPPTVLAAAIGLAVLGGVWLIVALWRFGRREA
jgi:ABC-type transport system involved in multi-copper enzyme maturation permease subunit